MGQSKKWVPDVIWQVFKYQARTLLETILHLIPPKCTCNSTAKGETEWRCLRCSFCQDCEGNPVSYLLRPDDPPNYRNLLKRSFVVVPRDAPPLPPYSTSTRRCSHLQILRRTIATILAGTPDTTNVLCSGYIKDCQDLTSNVKLLNSSAWDLLSERVGARMMSYILFHAFIFLPIPYGKYQQVAGFPVSDLIKEARKKKSELQSSVNQGFIRKRRRGTRGSLRCKKKLSTVLPCQEGPQTSSGLLQTETDVNLSVQHASGKLNGNQDGLSISQGNVSLYSCCSAFQTSLGVPKGTEIKRPGLYNLESSPYLLPTKHMLYSANVSNKGANFLMRKIFTLPKVNHIERRNPFPHSKASQSHGSACIHSLVKLLKLFISRAHRCNNNKLLDKHCPFPIQIPKPNKHHDLSTGSKRGAVLPAKRQQPNLQERNVRQKKSQTPEPSDRKIEAGVIDSQPCLNLSNSSRKRKRSHTSEFCSGKSNMEVFDSQPCLNNCYNTRAEVVSFIWASCRRMVPEGLLGGPFSWRALRRNISRFVRLRRYEKITLKQCMSDLKISEFPVFSSKSYSCCSKGQIKCGTRECATSDLRHRLFEMWIFCFFSHIVGPIIQSNFYVTETQHGKQEMYFYRKPVWKKISDHAIAILKKQDSESDSGVKRSVSSVKRITCKRPWGFSKLRICPKQSGFRTIASLTAASRFIKPEVLKRPPPCLGDDHFGYLKPVNHFLRGILPVLRDLLTKNREKWGSSVFNYNDIYEKFVPFLMSVKKDMDTMPTPFIVVSDVEKAFDTVKHKEMLRIVDEILTKDEYVLQKLSEVVCRRKSFWSCENLRLMNKQSPQIKSSGPSRPWNTIVIDQEQSEVLKKQKIKFYLHELLMHNVLYVDQHFMMQKAGIPQGSALSTLLCSLYLGDLESKRVFPYLRKFNAADQETANVNNVSPETSCKASRSIKYTLLRFTDDFLFISTSKEQAASFLSRLQIGFYDYNINMNEDKYRFNFETDDSTKLVSRGLVVADDGFSFIPWGGLLINSQTLEIQADYTKYKNNHLSSTLTINRQAIVGKQLKLKLRDYMKPKCHPIFFDSNVNSRAIVRLNIYQAFVLAAMKFHGYIRELHITHKFQPGFYSNVIEGSLTYMHKLIWKRMRTAAVRCEWEPILELKKDETVWLGRMAYIRVLSKKEARYKGLIGKLRSKVARQGDIGSCPELKYAVEDSHSSYMWKLKY